MSINTPYIVADSEFQLLRSIPRWKYDPASDLFDIGRVFPSIFQFRYEPEAVTDLVI